MHSHLPEFCANVAWEGSDLVANFRPIRSSCLLLIGEDEHLGLAFSSTTRNWVFRNCEKKIDVRGEVLAQK